MSIAEKTGIEFEEDDVKAGQTSDADLTQRHVRGNRSALTVAELVIRYRETRDSGLCGVLFERHRRMLDNYLLRTGAKDDHEREDLLQEVFVQAQRKIDDLKDPVAFGAWIKSIARRMNINKHQRSRAPMAMEHEMLELHSHVDDAPTANILLLQKERTHTIRAALKRMKPMDKLMLKQFYFDGLSLIEMSEKNDAPMGTIKRRLHTARGRLEVLLGQVGIDGKTL